MSWRLPFATCKLPTNVTLTVASVLLLSVHSGIFVSDLYHFAISQRFDLMSFPSTTVLLFSQVLSFYLALLGALYSTGTKDNVLKTFALTSLVTNFAAFFGRFCLEYLTLEYRQEVY
ncbi:cation channel sperm-associated auxiliary subunit TMEM262 [Alligator mississippiensis]|uniref:Transmembrane protein 262 n=1 Tax=Alligator mississippiensis TaxID=8496 RepID=A0A151NA95_ALLMI|nr:cation channel sperm-associated auxiliary subunit TMEM262 [Alligator mississippiensis]KYO33753.1 transmembrane protein 262 [Alligator mississippiensis]